MGIRSTNSGGAYGYMQRRLNAALDHEMDEVEVVVEEVMEDAATYMKKLISERGVHNTVPTGDGRGTGNMENAVDSRVIRQGDVLRGSFGWLPGTNRPKHYGWQEDGTYKGGQPEGDPDPRKAGRVGMTTSLSPRGIRPMMALYDAEQLAREMIQDRVRRKR